MSNIWRHCVKSHLGTAESTAMSSDVWPPEPNTAITRHLLLDADEVLAPVVLLLVWLTLALEVLELLLLELLERC